MGSPRKLCGYASGMTDGLPLPRCYLAIGALCLGTALIIIDGGVARGCRRRRKEAQLTAQLR